MYDVIRTVHLVDASRASGPVLEHLRSVTGRFTDADVVIAPTLPGARNGGDILLRLRFEVADRWHAHRATLDEALTHEDIHHVVGASFESTGDGSAGRRAGPDQPGIYRTMLAKVHPDTPAEQVAAFERATLQMPRHVPQIRAWQLTRVTDSVGATDWTHAWEQEYDHVDGLLDSYMNHPIHWAHVDRWFDPEHPLWIVRDRVVHTFCAIDRPVLGVAAPTGDRALPDLLTGGRHTAPCGSGA